MQIVHDAKMVHDGADEPSEIDVQVLSPHATVADLADALHVPVDAALEVDGRVANPGTPLSDAGLQGALVRPTEEVPERQPPSARSRLSLAVTGGLVAGPIWPLDMGITTVGRSPTNDIVLEHPTVSGRHCSITLEGSGPPVLADLGSYDGTWVGDESVDSTRALVIGSVFRIGAVELSLLPAPEPDLTGGLTFNRPPRSARTARTPPLSPPDPPPPIPPTPPLSLVTLLAPLGLAAVMVAVMGSMVFALFALLAPVMAAGTWFESRRRNRACTKRQRSESTEQTRQFEAQVRRAVDEQVRRLEDAAPDPAQLFRWATTAASRLWERRPEHDDFLCLRAGTGDVAWRVPVAGQTLSRILRRAPVVLDAHAACSNGTASERSVIGLVGHRSAALAMARSLVCQAATQAGPADLAVAVLTTRERVPQWDWAKWLPHTRDTRAAFSGRARLLSDGRGTSEELLEQLMGSEAKGLTLLVVDDESLLLGRGRTRAALAGRGGPVLGLVMARNHHLLPAACNTVIELLSAEGQAAVRDNQDVEQFLASGVTEPLARSWARHLSRIDDPEAPLEPKPVTCSLVSLLEFDPRDPESVRIAWKDDTGSSKNVPLGTGENGVASIDLLEDGPHFLFTGLPPSACTELLAAVAAGLAVRFGPDQLHLALLHGDGPNGPAAFSQLDTWPQTVGVAGPDHLEQALGAIELEVGRRHHLGRPSKLPALVVVVDDVTALGTLPGLSERMAELAERGPAVGLHLLTAAQRASDLPGPLSGVLNPTALPAQIVSLSGSTPPRRAIEVVPFCFAPRLRHPHQPKGADWAGTAEAVRSAMAGSGLSRPALMWGKEGPDPPAVTGVGLLELMGLTHLDDPAGADGSRPPTWSSRSPVDRLRVPIGITPENQPLLLDLKESARGGIGPHGLVVGATGSGKSELLRTLVTALAITHPPEDLCFVFVDFKGGATFSDLSELPHAAGMITNLQDDLSLVDRMHDALYGEQRRRQALLRQAGNSASLTDYQVRREGGADLPPLPSLIVIVDEFAELLAARPDFIDLFLTLGRLGRSLGMHLLLASQRLDEARLKGLESHLSYRICLRTFSAPDSRAVLGVPDAHHLPPEPGNAYLQVDHRALKRFRVALSSAPLLMPQVGHRVHQVWLPPLERAVTLDQVLARMDNDEGRLGSLMAPVGLTDHPHDQVQHPLIADLSGAAGNLAVVGAPRTGKSTLLCTLVAAFCLTHSPEQANFYCIDYGGDRLAVLDAAPHVGTVTGRMEPQKVRRVVSEVESTLIHRQRSSAGGRPSEEAGPHIFLVIDNWSAFRQGFEDLEATITDIATRGLGYGIHVVLSANRWMDIRPILKDAFGGRLELRLNDPNESAIDRRAAATIASSTPGRGLTPEGVRFQAALPRMDSQATVSGEAAATEDLMAQLRSSYPGRSVPPVRMLPELIPFTDLPAPGHDPSPGVPLGIGEDDLAPAYLDLVAGDPHFLVLGDSESGKTNLLRAFLAGLTSRHDPAQAMVLVIDYRRTLMDAVHPDHLIAYAGTASTASDQVARLRELLVGRLPDAGVSRRQLRDRDWWSGPEVYLIVDDYDLVPAAAGNPLAPLGELLAHSRDIGLHLMMARRAAGFSRAVFEPVLQRVKDLISSGIILSGDRQEGTLLGPHRASEQPPGRGILVQRRRQPKMIQVAWAPE